MRPADKKTTEVVYRRSNLPAAVSPDAAATTDLAKRAFVRTITPLFIGFLLLLGLISGLGWRSAKEMEFVGENARDTASQTAVRQTSLSDLRLKIAQVDTEARVRHTALSQKGLTPPFSFKLDSARDQLKQAIAVLDRTSSFQDPDWTRLRTDLQKYVELSRDVQRYGLEGHDQFSAVNSDIDKLYAQLQALQKNNLEDMLRKQRAARNSIFT